MDRHGLKLVEVCKTYHHASAEIVKCKTSIAYTWFRIGTQVKCLREACKHLDPEFLQILDDLLVVLVSELTLLTAKVQRLSKDSRGSRLKYVFLKKSLESVISSLDVCQQKFYPHWYMEVVKFIPENISIVRPDLGSESREPTPLETARLIQVVLSPENPSGLNDMFCTPIDAEHARVTDIEGSTAKVLRHATNKNKAYIIDSLRCSQIMNAAELESDVTIFARKLRAINPVRFSMLQCKGIQRTRAEGNELQYDLIFRFPSKSTAEPTSLASLIASARQHSLSERLKIAQQLARAVSYVHILDFVHKNIRPESVLAFGQTDESLGSLYLVGFEMFRREGGETRLRGDSSWVKNIYRHPERQGETPKRKHLMQHDIYSLGVCLLEIGLWTPILPLIAEAERNRSIVEDVPHTFDSRNPLPLHLVKRYLERLANTGLPSVMGDQYRDVVVTCLTCLDAENLDFADDIVSEGITYVEKVGQLRLGA